eukprot:gene2369-2836_t
MEKHNSLGLKIKEMFSFSKPVDQNSYISPHGVLLSKSNRTLKFDNENSPRSERRKNIHGLVTGNFKEFESSIHDLQSKIEKYDDSSTDNRKSLETQYFNQIESEKKIKERNVKMKKLLTQFDEINSIRSTGGNSIQQSNVDSFDFLCEKFLTQLKEEVSYSKNLETRVSELNNQVIELSKNQQNDQQKEYQVEIEKIKREVHEKTQEMLLKVDSIFEKEHKLRVDLINQLDAEQEKNCKLKFIHSQEIENCFETIEYVKREIDSQREKFKYLIRLKSTHEEQIQQMTVTIDQLESTIKNLSRDNEILRKRVLNSDIHAQIHLKRELDKKNNEVLCLKSELDNSTKLYNETEIWCKNEIKNLFLELEESNLYMDQLINEKIQFLKKQHSKEIDSLQKQLQEKNSQLQKMQTVVDRKGNYTQENFDQFLQNHHLEISTIVSKYEKQMKKMEIEINVKSNENMKMKEHYESEISQLQLVIENNKSSIKDLKDEKSRDYEDLKNFLEIQKVEFENDKQHFMKISDQKVNKIEKEYQTEILNYQNIIKEMELKYHSNQQNQLKILQNENDTLKNKIKKLVSNSLGKQNPSTQNQEIEEYQELLKVEYERAKKLHNELMELNGNIQVICRIKPPTKKDQKSFIHLPKEDDSKINLLEKFNDISGRSNTKVHSFMFNKVFPSKSTQEDLFFEVSKFIQSAMDGDQVCVFAYGQTSSGKTYTMMREDSQQNQQGMIQQSVHKIFSDFQHQKNISFSVESSFIEIYKDKIYDLLNLEKDIKYEIRHENEITTIVGLGKIKISSVDEFMKFMRIASKNRTKGITKKNDRSSRSHVIIQLKISNTNLQFKSTTEGLLNFIDLSGSERMSQTEGYDERSKETKYINKSLSCLGDVIHSIANKEIFIPYRNSILTFLLKNSLSKNSKVLMIVNISSNEDCMNESLNSLRFAKKANSCELANIKK